jgi:protein gp37
MGDLFHEDVRVPFIDQCFAVMALASRHTFQVLTKRPERMRNYFDLSYVTDFPLEPIGSQVRIAYSAGKIHEMFLSKGKDLPLGYSLNQPYQNVWLGVSVEDQQTADERIPLLLQTKAAVRFVSYEPALGPLSFVSDAFKNRLTDGFHQSKIDWVIAGGESGRNARPSHPDWFRAVRDQCQAAGVPFFFKQWGEWNPTKNSNVVRPSDAGKLSRYTVACSTVREEIGQTVYHAYPSVPQDGIGIYERLEQVGKKRAGRMLDGREWNEFPQ